MRAIGAEPGGAAEARGARRAVARCEPVPYGRWDAGRICASAAVAYSLGRAAGAAGAEAAAARGAAPAPPGRAPAADAGYVADALRGAPLSVGDSVTDPVGGPLRMRLQVTGTEPEAPAVAVTRDTGSRIAEAGEGSGAAPDVRCGPVPGARRLRAAVRRMPGGAGPARGPPAPAGVIACQGDRYARRSVPLARAAAGECGAHFAVVPAEELLHGKGGRPRSLGRRLSPEGALRRGLPSGVFDAARRRAPSAVPATGADRPDGHAAPLPARLMRGLEAAGCGRGAQAGEDPAAPEGAGPPRRGDLGRRRPAPLTRPRGTRAPKYM